MSRLNELVHSRHAFLIGSLVWLPAGVILTSVVRVSEQLATPMGWLSLLAASTSLIVVAPCGMPLAFACRRLWRHGYPRVSWLAMAALGAITVAATQIAGLLGPIAIAIYAVVLSAPVWVVVAILGRGRKNNAGQS